MFSSSKSPIITHYRRLSPCFVILQTLSYMLQTLLTGQYSVLSNNVSSPQVHLVMHQLNQSYTQLAWQQNNVQR